MTLQQIAHEQLIERSDQWILLKRIDENKRSANVYKIVESLNQESVSNLYYELEVTRLLQSKYTLQPIQIEQQEMNHQLVYKYDESISFNKYFTKPLQVLPFLKIALELTNIFIDIHQSSLVYRNIHRRNFLINEKTNEIKIINLEYAYKYHRESLYKMEEQQSLHYRSGYFAPEETGRLNDSIDYRTDLYSLGVLFYEMVTGFLPFQQENHQQLFYEIITNEPSSIKNINHNFPQPIVSIIEKLLRKNKVDRYQSAKGLKEDLLYCWNMLVNNKELSSFELGKRDERMFEGLSSTIPSREETAQGIINHVVQNREQYNQVIFIEGDTGSGKTKILDRIKNECIQSRAIILEARMDSTLQNVQLAPIVSAIRNQMKYIYMEGSARVGYMKDIIENEKIFFYDEIFQLIPELRWFVSEPLYNSTITAQFSPVDIKTLFHRTIQQLLSVLFEYGDSFVVLIDNAHLIDSSSLQCLEIAYNEMKPIHFVFTYRYENEAIKELRRIMKDAEHIYLNPLRIEEINAWLEYSLKEKSDNILRLASLLYDLTKGNPLFIHELFQTFMQMNLVYYSLQHKCWKMDLQKMADMNISRNLMDFFASRIDDLTMRQKEILEISSCLGTTFDLDILEKFLHIPRIKIIEVLDSLIQDGTIIPLNEKQLFASTFDHVQMYSDLEFRFSFVHTEVQKVIYDQISSSDRLRIHYHLAIILEESLFDSVADDELLKVIQHFNLCRELLTKEEKLKLAKWNLRIGTNTTYSGLFQNAEHFLLIATALFEEERWSNEREFVLELWRITGISKYTNGFYDEAEAYFDKGLAYARTNFEKLVLYNDKILFYSSLSSDEDTETNTQKALATAIEALSMFNIELKENISTVAILKEYSLLNKALQKEPMEQLLNLKKNEDETIYLILKVLLNVLGSALVINEKLFSWLILRALRLVLKHGDVDFASIFYSNFAGILLSGFHDTKRSYQFGLLAIKHVERENKSTYKMNVYLNYGINVGIWNKPYMNSIYYLKLGLDYSLNSKLHDLFSALSVAYMLHIMVAQNKPLKELLQEAEAYNVNLYQTKNSSPIELVHELKEWILCLTTHTKQLNWHQQVTNKSELSNWENHIALRLQMSYLFHEEDAGMDLLEKMDDFPKVRIMTIAKAQSTFYSALWMMRLLLKKKIIKRTEQKYEKHIRLTLKQFQQYSEHAPENFEHLYYLLKAEYSRYLKKTRNAILYYDRAIQLASLNRFPCDHAIACRCAALFYEERNERNRAEKYIQQAVERLNQWGAFRLAKDWELQYEHLLRINLQPKGREVLLPIDMDAIIEINQILSSETQIDDLIQKVLLIMMKHADATHSYFFKTENSTMQFVAKAELNNQSFNVGYEYDSQKESLSLQSIIEYVLISEQHVIIDNTDLPSPFQLNSYEKSILCLPIFYQGNITAILYLANTMTPYVFTNEKIELLKIISGQVAISMEHTKIYEQLEEQVKERTEKLHKMNIHLNEMNERLMQNETERKLLLQNVSHDFRSPITAAIGYIESILDGVATEPEQQTIFLERSRERLFSLNYLIQDILDLSQLESGRMNFYMEKWNVNHLFSGFDKKFRQDVKQAGLTYTSSFIVDGDYDVALDIARIEQVLNNLISNAIKYSNEGTIHFSMSVENDKWVCSVEDAGIGIPEKELPFIFDMHYRASNNKLGNSNGIGLSICKQIMTHHQGDIVVESTEGNGSVFSIIIGLE